MDGVLEEEVFLRTVEGPFTRVGTPSCDFEGRCVGRLDGCKILARK